MSQAGLPSADERWMRRALELAGRGDGWVSPNPLVGAVVVQGSQVVGEGWHRRFGGPHAEVEALASAGRSARGATLYVTLEPCNHQGKTRPCTDAVVSSGVCRVIAAMRDPNPAVRGGGIRALHRGGIAAAVGLLRGEASRLNESFVKHVTRGTPLVRLKWASSLDGRIATGAGEARWISGPAARRWAHQARRWSDAVLVGVGTVLADDPRLDVRLGRPRRPVLRVVLDSRLRTPRHARVLDSQGGPVIVYTTVQATVRRQRALEAAGATVVVAPAGADGRPRLGWVLRDLGGRGVGRLLVEGGGEVIAAFLRAGLVDRASVVLSGLVLGGDAIPAVATLGVTRLARAPRLRIVEIQSIGPDVLVEARL